MIELLYTVIGAQMALILTLIFNTPLRKLLIMGLDKLKRGRGPLMVKTVDMTVFVVLLFSVYSMSKIRDRTIEAGIVDPTEEVLMAKHMLEASLMGFMLFLSLMIDRLHHYIKVQRLLTTILEAVKKKNRGNEDGKNVADELKALREETAALRTEIKKLESECGTKADQAKAAEANAEALRKQSEGLLMEYDHLLEENQNLRTQLQSIEQSFVRF
ncbi:hypothetical protein UlMin_022956 [Ulmus minor]